VSQRRVTIHVEVGGIALQVAPVGLQRVRGQPAFHREMVEVCRDRIGDRRIGGQASTSSTFRAGRGRCYLTLGPRPELKAYPVCSGFMMSAIIAGWICARRTPLSSPRPVHGLNVTHTRNTST